jgi:translation initiation factor IF-1
VVLKLLIMPARPNPVRTTGTLRRRHGERTWMTVLPNGAETLAHIPTWKLDSIPVLQEGDRVRLEMTQYDFSTARIAGKAGT